MLRAQWGDLHLPLSKLAAAKQRRNDVLAPLERKYTTQSPQLHPLFMEGLGIGDICFLRTAEKVVQGNVPPPRWNPSANFICVSRDRKLCTYLGNRRRFPRLEGGRGVLGSFGVYFMGTWVSFSHA